MKLATYANGSRDGELLLVSRDLTRATRASGIATRMIDALEAWETLAPRLHALADALESGDLAGAFAFEPERCLAPLPRAPQWLDASAFLEHGRLMDRAFANTPNPDFETIPMVYQGASDDFRGPCDDIGFPDEALQIDCEGEFGVILSEVPMATPEAQALQHVRLLVQINDWSLRALAPREMRTGFGWVQAKPSSSFAPVAITPDELGPLWHEGRVHLRLHVTRGEVELGRADASQMHFPFQRLIAHCARTRRLSPGTVIGSGTVANVERAVGSSCLAEVRVVEWLQEGTPRTPFLSFGERIRMEARTAQGQTPFGAIDNRVVAG